MNFAHYWKCVILLILLAVLLSEPLLVDSQEPDMRWQQAADSRALCNDYTRAGFFISRNQNSRDWIIFFESGGVCYSRDTCNRRFFSVETKSISLCPEEVQREFSSSSSPPYFNSFNLQEAWETTIRNRKRRPSSQVVSPLMTSLNCFIQEDKNVSASASTSFVVRGRDILDRNASKNPLFHDYNRIIIPYCSSDAWLGEDVHGSECDCFDFESCFPFDPSNETLQFTFRGKIIGQTIITQLIDSYNLTGNGHLVIVGSGVGGLGALNHAKWIQQQLGNSTGISLIIDSSWFVNFQGSILQNFFGTLSLKTVQNDTLHLLQNYEKYEACRDITLGYPCCFSAHCVMTCRNSSGQLAYFSESIKTFVVSSTFDIFSLAPAATAHLASDDDINQLLTTVHEFGVQLATTLSLSSKQVPSLSYYLTECFQHIYFATSTLWDDPDGVFSNQMTENVIELDILSNTVTSEKWTTLHLASLQEGGTPVTILEALQEWMNMSTSVRYSDRFCEGPSCNPNCPDRLTIGRQSSNNWPIWSKIVIACVIVVITVICVLVI